MKRRLSGPLGLAVGMALFLSSLSFVVWRQARALEVLGALEQGRQARAIAEAERVDLFQEIRQLEGLARIERVAREQLGMHLTTADEMVILEGDFR